MLKRVFTVTAFLLLLVSLCGCKSDKATEVTGTIYNLEEAYDKGYLSRADIERLSTLQVHDDLDPKVELAIKESRVQQLKEQGHETTIEDVVVWNFYGRYGKDTECYIVAISDNFTLYVLGPYNVIVGDMSFDYMGPQLYVWRQND